MRLTRVRFKLMHLMIAVAAWACFLVLLETPGGFLIICVLWILALAVITYATVRGQRRRAGWWFAIASITVIGSLATWYIHALDTWGIGIACMFFGSVFGSPLILGFVTAWAVAATRRQAVRRRSPLLAWPLVIALATQPLTILLTQWPLRLAFLVSKPSLDRLADRVATGKAPSGPIRAGLFMVVGSAIDPTNGNVGLITNPDPSGRSGFVRVSRTASTSPSRVSGPFYNLNGDLQMGWGWRFQNED